MITNETPFMDLMSASRATGLSTYYLRKGCKAGDIPHLRSGTKIYVNIPALLRKLDAETEKESA